MIVLARHGFVRRKGATGHLIRISPMSRKEVKQKSFGP